MLGDVIAPACRCHVSSNQTTFDRGCELLMPDNDPKTPASKSKEERIAEAKARAAAAAQPVARAGGEDESLSEAALRFQKLKEQQSRPSRKEREAALLQKAIGVAPRESVEKIPQAAPQEKETLAVNRREFLTYAWGAALGLALVQGGAATLWYAYPRFKAGEFGGVFTLTSVPEVGAKPEEYLDGKFWWSNSENGLAALYKVCTHLGCLYEWKEQTQRFECPCHGSKFRQDGRNIHGPATRDLDQFIVTVEDTSGNHVDETTEEHRYVVAQEGLIYKVDTGRKILGRPSDPKLQLEA
ncbi:MAG: Rieske (2Fe-2S) protein [Caldilineae bacterium]|nr:MAG: Rieske (2Fe-2S) protein [Caldilineae bacterium]